MISGKIVKLTMLFLVVAVLSACNISEEQVQQHASDSFEEKLNQEKKTTTYKTNDIELYIPSFTEVEVLDEYNLVLERENHLYLLFLNDLPYFESREQLLEEVMVESEPFIFKKLKTEEGHGAYLIVTEFDDEQYRVVVGYNGVKITTICTLAEMNSTAELMYDIVQSVKK
ncbi:hypothetical protein ACERII_17300 [Evansella sp. AB-rgal1]|uniref:hypothetical protein n=1 Tax=Evansella sp. AB-rgal1 TaxID=3242696 RepID=UPI00359DC7FE